MTNQNYRLLVQVLCLIIGLPIIGTAQNAVDKKFNWEDADESKTLYVNVKKGAEEISMNFDGRISKGSFLMTAYDPDGNKVGGFSLVCSGAGNSNVHIDISDGDHHHHHHTDGNGHSNTQTDSHSTTTTTTTVTTTDDGKVKVKRKNKSKNKNKNKGSSDYSYSSSNSDAQGSKGVMKKTISDPSPGKWKFVLEAKGVTGTLSAEIDQD